MRLIFVSDLHGNKSLYGELKDLIITHKADAVIIGGDLFNYSPNIEPQLQFAKEFLYDFFKEIKIPIYLIPGNVDRPKAVEFLYEMKEEGLINILRLSGTPLLNNIQLYGYEYFPPSPFKIKDYEKRDLINDSVNFEIPCLLSDEHGNLELVPSGFLNNLTTIEEELSLLTDKKSIWVIHVPPYGGILDKTFENIYAGSKAVRKQIEKVQPILTLHGHIHEAPSITNQWYERIGNTLSVNPGKGESLHAVISDIDTDGNILSMKHNVYGELKQI